VLLPSLLPSLLLPSLLPSLLPLLRLSPLLCRRESERARRRGARRAEEPRGASGHVLPS
jgi:hypothetical protein